MKTAGRRLRAFSVRLSSLALVLLVWGVLGGVPCAQAEGAPKTVVMVVDPSALPLAQRLRQEIESLGLVVRWLPAARAELPSLEAEARQVGAVASIRIAPMGGGDVDMTIVDRDSGKSVSWKLVAASSTDPAAGELIATRAVELLRASLVEMAARPRPSPPRGATPGPAAPRPPRASPPRDDWALLVAPGLLKSPEFRPSTQLLSAVSWLPWSRLGLSLSVSAPIAPARLSRDSGSVELFATLYRVGPVLDVTSRGSALALRLTAGLGASELRVRGVASPGYVAAADEHWVATSSLSVTARLRLAPHLGLVADATGSAAFPRTVVRVAGREATEWGRPALGCALGIEVSTGLGAP